MAKLKILRIKGTGEESKQLLNVNADDELPNQIESNINTNTSSSEQNEMRFQQGFKTLERVCGLTQTEIPQFP